MAYDPIDLGTTPGDGTGDALRTGGQKINDMFAELFDDSSDFAAAFAALPGIYQPLDSDLTAIAALATTAFGRSFLALADALASRTLIGLKKPLPSGRWLLQEGLNSVYATNVAGGAGSMRGYIGYIREKVTITGLGVRIGTAAASGLFQMAIYAADPVTLFPTGAPLYSSGSQSTTTAGGVEVTGLSIALEPGYYWFFTNCDATAATAIMFCQGINAMDQTMQIGRTSAILAINGTGSLSGFSKPQTFNTWPTLTGNPTTDSLTAVITVSIPLIAFLTA